MSERSQLDPKDACRLIVGLVPSTIDEQLSREVLGSVLLTSMSDVAQAFGVSAATVRNTWRRDGMPGTAKRGTIKENKFPLADVLIWWLRRNAAAATARGATPDTIRKQAADALA